MTKRECDESRDKASEEYRPLAVTFACLLCACATIQAKAGDLHDAIRSADTAALEQGLASGLDVDATEDAVGTALHIAVIMEDLEAIRLLHDHGADLEAPNRISGAHPLHIAADIGLPPVLNLLVDLGADLEALDDLGRTPLIHAALAGNSAAVEVLLAAGAEADAAETRRGTTALHLAAFRNRLDVIDALLAHGAGVDAADDNGETALFWAIGRGHAAAITRLVNAGADVNHRNRAGVGTLGAAAYAYDREAIARLLKLLGAAE